MPYLGFHALNCIMSRAILATNTLEYREDYVATYLLAVDSLLDVIYPRAATDLRMRNNQRELCTLNVLARFLSSLTCVHIIIHNSTSSNIQYFIMQ